jgi:hypothetical protein
MVVVSSGGGPGPSTSYQAVTDDEGAFRFAELPAGRYIVQADKSGYVNSGQGMAGRPAAQDVVAGKEPKAFEIKLQQQGVITGRVLDADGEPVERANVQAVSNARTFRGMVAGAQTDDRGVFRLSKLAPGKYKILATRMPFGNPNVARQREIDAPTYHPATLDEATATEVSVASGEELGGVDIRLQKSVVVRVSGKIAGAPPGSFPHISLQPIVNPAAMRMMGFMGGGTSADPEGNFTLYGVRPGEYFLMANAQQAGQQIHGYQRIRVQRDDLEGVQVTIRPTIRVEGVVRAAESDQKPPLQNVYINLQPVEMGLSGGGGGAVQPDGRFQIYNVGRDKLLLNATVRPPWFIKDVIAGNQRSTNLEVDLSVFEGPLEVILSNRGAVLEGAVEGDEQSTGTSVVIVPAGENLSIARIASGMKTVRTTPGTNRFRVEGLRPGTYRVFAGDPSMVQSLIDPSISESLRSKGVEVTASEGAVITVNPKLFSESVK